MARRLLGPRFFPAAGRLYRRIFVDLDEVVRCLPALPQRALVLDVGGGDGELIARLLARRADLRVVMIDRNPQLGGSLGEAVRSRVELRAGTSLSSYREEGGLAPDAVLISDVVHHVPPSERAAFLADVHDLSEGGPAMVVIKDIQPGSFTAWLSRFADRYVSGDRQVELIPQDDLEALATRALVGFSVERTALLERDPPNYCSVFRRPAAPPGT